mmetsp:Transcript_3856/g.12908  ORF Transcript_3856/g.12908 Transcript_3856/m.12908 type:complete len:215 (+) Transcript_3856:559-1203(+)
MRDGATGRCTCLAPCARLAPPCGRGARHSACKSRSSKSQTTSHMARERSPLLKASWRSARACSMRCASSGGIRRKTMIESSSFHRKPILSESTRYRAPATKCGSVKPGPACWPSPGRQSTDCTPPSSSSRSRQCTCARGRRHPAVSTPNPRAASPGLRAHTLSAATSTGARASLARKVTSSLGMHSSPVTLTATSSSEEVPLYWMRTISWPCPG